MVEPPLASYDEDRAFGGYTLFAESCDPPSSGRTGTVYLIDVGGRPVHRWHVETALQSHCQLLSNGNLLYPTRDRSRIEEAGLRELDPAGNVVWEYHCRIDHDFFVAPDGHRFLHTITDHVAPAVGPELTRHPYVIEIDRKKNLHWEWHGDEHLAELEAQLGEDTWNAVRERIEQAYPFDWAHNNTLQRIPENETFERERESDERPIFRPGNIVFSYRSLDVIGVIEYPSGEIVWAWGPDELDGQHLPHVLANGNLLIFDNGTERGWSRVIELNPRTEEIEWEYTGSPKDAFYSPYISGARRLPNGNTLICEGSKAHLFEVTPDGDVVWSFVNPYGSAHDRGSIYRCQRYTDAEVAPLLDEI